MAIEFEVSSVIPATPEKVYKAWLDSEEHAAMTGGEAKIDPAVGGKFEAWDGYISGTTLELEPEKRIVQAWRTTEFEVTDPDSRLEVLLAAVKGGTRITLRHSNLPAHGMQYKEGWVESYFDPMKEYFGH